MLGGSQSLGNVCTALDGRQRALEEVLGRDGISHSENRLLGVGVRRVHQQCGGIGVCLGVCNNKTDGLADVLAKSANGQEEILGAARLKD